MTVRDWRDADPADTQVLYAREQEYWVRELAWDASTAWREIEQARVTWGLPGYLAIDRDRTLRGWAYYLPEGETVHLGGIVADTREATSGLLDACLESAMRPPRPARVSCFLPSRAEGFEEALRERGFTCEHYRYLSRPIAAGVDHSEADSWTAGDLLPAAALLREAYGEEGRHFAPRGTPVEWEQYIRSLVERPGCGVIEPAVTRVVRNGTNLQALVLATRIAPGTLHLPQVAVHPSRRREGLAQRLVEEACRAAAARGVKQATLLVAESNASARALYQKIGFTDTSAFIAATLVV
ncbi:MAG TPA: GNAT family N-acetyltransferase [Vicinamibacterales bacterium]|nr:GNAT family N-acetyltransferase [Vicinamibacterales bacterium]